MRHTIAVVVMLFILTAGLVMPATAGEFAPVQSTTSSSSTSLGWSIPIYIKGEMKSPAGRIGIYFTHRKYGEGQFWYTGSSREIRVSAGIPAFSWVVARIELTGAYANQVVRSEWQNLGSREENTFCSEITPGINNAVFYIQGREKKYLCIPFFDIPIGSSGFTVEQSFRVYCQNDMVGLTSYKVRLQTARATWPLVRFYELDARRFVRTGDENVNWQRVVDTHELYAKFYVYEREYQLQGMIIAGSEDWPCNDSASLRDWLEVMQRQAEAEAQAQETAAAEADYQRQLEEAEAARKAAEAQRAADAAEYQRKLAEAESARRAAEEQLANPPAPVTTTTITTETTSQVVQPRPDVPVTLCSWRLNLPAGKVVCVETLDDRGERKYPKRYSGYIPFNNYVVGQSLCLRLTWEGASAPDPWKVVRNVRPDKAFNYSELEVR